MGSYLSEEHFGTLPYRMLVLQKEVDMFVPVVVLCFNIKVGAFLKIVERENVNLHRGLKHHLY